MRKVAGRELCLTILQLKGDRRLADNIVLHLASTQRYEDVVVPMPERGCVRRNFHLEDPNILVFDGAMMTGLGGDLDFARSLPGNNRSRSEDKDPGAQFHAVRFQHSILSHKLSS